MIQKYRVLHIITRAISSGGAEKNTFLVIKGLDKEKYDIHLAIGADSEAILEDLGVKIITIKHLKRNVFLFFDILAFFEIWRLIRKNKYHLVHTHQSKAGMLGRLAAKLAGVPLVVHTVHAPLFYENQNFLAKRFFRFLEKFLAYFTDWFVAVGTELKDYYLENGIGEREKFRVIRSGIQTEKFKPVPDFQKLEIRTDLGIKGNPLIVGMVGRMEKIKGFEDAIKAARLVLRDCPETKFVFAGRGNYEKALKKKSADLKGRVIFSGFRSDIEKIMDVFDILISTSPKEGVSQSLVQGALLGKPIVCFKTMGAREIVKENGFIVRYKDTEEMAERIKFLIQNPESAKTMGEKGKIFAREEWNAKKTEERNNEFYEKLFSVTEGKINEN